jgi:site-specific DNA recombinase
MKQAAMYVRVSTTQQKEEQTIDSQKSVLLGFAASKGFEIPSKLIFEDNGFSGSNLARPALDKLRDFASYGYRYIKDSIENKAYLEINDKEVSVIKIIFDLYTKERYSMGKIKKYLEAHKIFSPLGKLTWCFSTIRNILKNSSYIGIAYYGKSEKCEPNQMRLPSRQVRIKERLTPKRANKNRDPSEWIPIPVPSIIDNATFNLAQDLLKRNIKLSPRNTQEGTLLQGLIVCKECGYSFKSKISGKKINQYKYYSCSRGDNKCKNKSIRVQDLDDAVWKTLITTLESPELLQKEICRRVSELKNEPYQLKQRQLQKKLAELEMESNRLLDAFQAGHIEMENLTARMGAIKKFINNTRRELVEFNPGLSKEQLLELTEAIKHFSKHLKESKNILAVESKRQILRMLIKEIQIGKNGVEINHIIPINENRDPNEIARLCTRRRDHREGGIGLNTS